VKALLLGNKMIDAVTGATEPMTRAELMEAATARKQTFEYVLALLLKLGVVSKVTARAAQGNGGRGKPATLYGPGLVEASVWLAQFADKGTTDAFNPPTVPAETGPESTPEF
jgi:hypothetical protein